MSGLYTFVLNQHSLLMRFPRKCVLVFSGHLQEKKKNKKKKPFCFLSFSPYNCLLDFGFLFYLCYRIVEIKEKYHAFLCGNQDGGK